MSQRGLRFPVEARTTDGVRYLIRPIRADDAQRERDFIAALSPHTRYQRFQHDLREPGDALIARLVHVDFQRTMALVAVTGQGPDERIIATAQYAADDDTRCEFAIVVADDWQCRGVGTTLVPLLFDYAARAGFAVIYGTILADNVRMIELAEWLGLTVEPHRPGEPTVRASRQLRPPVKRAAGGWLAAAGAVVDPAALSLLVAANATPVLVARLLGKRLGTPLDAAFGRSASAPLFGAHKTWRGLVAGILACALLGAWLPCGAWVGAGFGALALAGDLASSYVKRRQGRRPGQEVPLLDQLPESLLPLLLFGGRLGLTGLEVIGTATLFTVLDMATARLRARRT
jgi:RimJ/RimL family protein N-acetyltransferase